MTDDLGIHSCYCRCEEVKLLKSAYDNLEKSNKLNREAAEGFKAIAHESMKLLAKLKLAERWFETLEKESLHDDAIPVSIRDIATAVLAELRKP